MSTHSSLYGEGHLNATRTRECVAMPGVRDQRVQTPDCIIQALWDLWENGIAYDPAHCEGSLVNADACTSTRGLIDPWPDFTYCNPPYGQSLFDPENEMETHLAELEIRNKRKAVRDHNKAHPNDKRPMPKFAPGMPIKKAGLKDWLQMQTDLSLPRREIVMLVPNRTNRPWFRKWRRYCDGLVELNPLAFRKFNGKTGKWEQQKSAFPAPLVLGYTGVAVGRFHRAFSHLGDPV